MRAIEPWVEQPLSTFLNESDARIAAVLTRSGQVVAQHGFATSPDLMAAAALSAGIVAASGELSRVIGAPPLRELAYEGRELGIYLAAIDLPGRRWLGLIGYGKETSLGLVQLFFDQMVEELVGAAPREPAAPPISAENLERELDASLK